MKRVRIEALAAYLPERVVSNEEIEYRVNHHQPNTYEPIAPAALEAAIHHNGRKVLSKGLLERLFGGRFRRFAAQSEQVSDIGAAAARPIVQSVGAQAIDCLIFAAASADMVEPATANMIQMKLGLSCPVFDLKNACNSFVNGVQVAAALVQSGQYQRVLVVSAEKLQDAIQLNISNAQDLRRRLAALTLGDGGGAGLVSTSTNGHGMIWQGYQSSGQYWHLSMVPGGGSLHPHSGYTYFEGHTQGLQGIFLQEFAKLLERCFQESGIAPAAVQAVFMHQVSLATTHAVADYIGIPRTRFFHTFPMYGNIAAASIPVSMYEAAQTGKIRPGDVVLVIGLGAGISIGVQLFIW
ncbi:MAG TPA: ketoacyl-ACP synthase III [Saprospiraceae bacterium]|nr:ketoacyl-ACP synthase III [Saprospiraceae bacterium]HMP14459.1 ketoacyl-ACP synthase III [Saprospiraceae bacterium]